ncbi:hypothetical protein PRUB_a6000 [Pseudoalteromonas rubra]|uniref:Uncharacterized protein n=1 Tax=Pseudoalteromonas rubra TaxID=43658 RepID=A0A8T0CF88_9GAMM|nr:hypothetical protein PRUB_a6000 [Pseudoalteromonas rubra]
MAVMGYSVNKLAVWQGSAKDVSRALALISH